MVRRHGWQYPAHTYQVVAITVFFVLVSVFYTFLSPFLGHPLNEYVASGIFSPVVFAVFFLYIRCTAIDPSDPGILSIDGLRGFAQQLKPSLAASAAQIANEEGRKGPLGLYCIQEWLVKGDKCRKDGIDNQLIPDEDLLYCTLCNAEVYKFSKHCRSCDKCVEGFDHHCRWLNNCIGRKNYVSFVCLTATCLFMLLLETISGLIVLTRCFMDKDDVRIHLTNKLGNGFSMAPFSALVALCTLTPLLASIPLGELFFFHMLLIRKGITTYEYVIAMRAQDIPQMGQQSVPLQQGGSNAPSWRGLSSLLNLPHPGAWCTPRRAKQQKGKALSRSDEGKLPCTIDADSTTVVERKAQKSSRHVIKISALKLALMNPKEAAQAATKARESSSVLRPVGFRSSFGTSETDCGSSCNVGIPSSTSLDYGLASSQKGTRKELENLSAAAASPEQDLCMEERDIERSSDHSSCPSSAPLSPLPAERRFGNPNLLRTSVNHMQIKGVGNARHGLQVCNATIVPQSSAEHPSWICTTPMSDGYDTLRCNRTAELGKSHIVSVNAHANGENNGNSRVAVYWDRAAGRFRSLPHSKKVSSVLPKPASAETWGGPHSVLSPGRCPMAANSALTPSISASHNCGKENSLKWAGESRRPVLMHNHIVLPCQSSKGPAPCQFQSSTSACRITQKNQTLSRFTLS